MLKTPAIIVASGEDLIIFPANRSGLGYLFPKGLVPDDVLLEPTKAIEKGKFTPKVKMAWNAETNNLVPQSVDGKGVDGKLVNRVQRELSKQMKDFTSLKDFFPDSQLEDFATTAILRTSKTTGITPGQARSMAKQHIDHQLVVDSMNALSQMGFSPNMKQLEAKNPLRDKVIEAGVALADSKTPTLEAEVEEI